MGTACDPSLDVRTWQRSRACGRLRVRPHGSRITAESGQNRGRRRTGRIAAESGQNRGRLADRPNGSRIAAESGQNRGRIGPAESGQGSGLPECLNRASSQNTERFVAVPWEGKSVSSASSAPLPSCWAAQAEPRGKREFEKFASSTFIKWRYRAATLQKEAD